MAKSRNISSISPADRNNFVTPEDIARKVMGSIGQAYIPVLGGSIHYREVGADRMHEFLKVGNEVTDRLPAMAQFVVDILCNEDGSDFLSFEQAFKFPLHILDEIIGGVAKAQKEVRKNA